MATRPPEFNHAGSASLERRSLPLPAWLRKIPANMAADAIVCVTVNRSPRNSRPGHTVNTGFHKMLAGHNIKSISDKR